MFKQFKNKQKIHRFWNFQFLSMYKREREKAQEKIMFYYPRNKYEKYQKNTYTPKISFQSHLQPSQCHFPQNV